MERDVWPIGEAEAKNVGQTAHIILKLLLYFD